jgi:putative oxidoreductase
MPWYLRGPFSLLGRLVLVAIFLGSAAHHIQDYQGTLKGMETQQVPYPPVLLPGALAFMILGSVSVLVGYKARIGALLLLVFLGLAAYFFHNFWTYAPDSKEFMREQIHFMKNVSMAGAMLFIIGNGAGYWSLDGRDV